MKTNRQRIEAVCFVFARRGRFLTNAEHDHELVSACPVGANRICVGRTGRPTPHPTSGAYRHRVGSKSGRHLAAGISEDERPQSRLSVFQPGQGGPGANPNSPLGTDARRLPPTRRVFADRGHQRTGLQPPSGLRGFGIDWQRSRSRVAVTQYAGHPGGGVGFGAPARRDRRWVDGPAMLATIRSPQTGPGDLERTHSTAAGIPALGGGIGANRATPGAQPVGVASGSGSRLLRTDRTMPAARGGFCDPRLPGSATGRPTRLFEGRAGGDGRLWDDGRGTALASGTAGAHSPGASAQRDRSDRMGTSRTSR